MASDASIRSTEIRVGIVTIIGVILLIIGITLGRGVSVSPTQKTVGIHFSSASGIETTSPVFINGLKRGSVSSVKPEPGGVLIKVLLDDASDLRRDATARLTILELTGGKKIELLTGSASEPWSGQDLQGVVAPDFGDILTFVGEVSGDAKNILRRLDSISAALGILLSDGSFVGNLKETATNANVAVAHLREIIENNRDNIQTSIKNLRSLSEDVQRIVRQNESGVTDLVRKLNRAADSAQQLLGSADSTLERANKLIRDVNGIVQDVRGGSSVASKILFDKDMGMKFDSTMNNLGTFVDQVLQNGMNVNVRIGSRP